MLNEKPGCVDHRLCGSFHGSVRSCPNSAKQQRRADRGQTAGTRGAAGRLGRNQPPISHQLIHHSWQQNPRRRVSRDAVFPQPRSWRARMVCRRNSRASNTGPSMTCGRPRASRRRRRQASDSKTAGGAMTDESSWLPTSPRARPSRSTRPPLAASTRRSRDCPLPRQPSSRLAWT